MMSQYIQYSRLLLRLLLLHAALLISASDEDMILIRRVKQVTTSVLR